MTKKILVIDDNPADMKIMVRYLGVSGYENIITAQTGQEGVEKALSEKPDLVITDTILPDIDGFEVTQKIREQRGPADPKIIVITGAIDAVDAVRARKMGADDYCAKTSDCGPLLLAVKKALVI